METQKENFRCDGTKETQEIFKRKYSEMNWDKCIQFKKWGLGK